ncbi:MAG TPA: hypothetical protein VLV15_00910, partial [Dongiaceae bacterium]|nr:hypothetical protein [Dongiaceae bacterium]
MTQRQMLQRFRRSQWRSIERMLRQAYQMGFESGLVRAHGRGRRGRTIRGDATVAGLVRRIERHFGLDRYGFEVRIVHGASGRRVAAGDLLRRYRVAAD